MPPGRDPGAPDATAGAAQAAVSVGAAALAWFPLLPLTVPVGYAAIAAVSGLLAMRSLRPDVHRRDWRMAVGGAALGTLYLLVHVARQMRDFGALGPP